MAIYNGLNVFLQPGGPFFVCSSIDFACANVVNVEPRIIAYYL